MFITEEFNRTNYLFVSMALEDSNILFTTPHVLCQLADRAILEQAYVDAALTYYVRTKNWDPEYIEHLRTNYLH